MAHPDPMAEPRQTPYSPWEGFCGCWLGGGWTDARDRCLGNASQPVKASVRKTTAAEAVASHSKQRQLKQQQAPLLLPVPPWHQASILRLLQLLHPEVQAASERIKQKIYKSRPGSRPGNLPRRQQQLGVKGELGDRSYPRRISLKHPPFSHMKI